MENQNPLQQSPPPQQIPPVTSKPHTLYMVAGAVVLLIVGFGAGYMIRDMNAASSKPMIQISPTMIPSPSVPVPTYDTRKLPTPTKDIRTPEQKITSTDGMYRFEIIKETNKEDVKITRLDGKTYPNGRNYFLVSEITGQPVVLDKEVPYHGWQEHDLILVPQQPIVSYLYFINADQKTLKKAPAGS